MRILATLGAIACIFLPCKRAYAIDLRKQDITTPGKSIQKLSLATPVVQILTSGSSGSAVVVGERPDAYIALTANHVVERSSAGELIVRLADSSQSKVKSVTRPIPGVDFAVLSFGKIKQVPLAILPILDKKLWQKVDEWPSVYVIGYSVPTPDSPNAILRPGNGIIESILAQSLDGYNFLYSATTLAGMSGGGIFGEPVHLMPFIKDPFQSTKEYFYLNNRVDKSWLPYSGEVPNWENDTWDRSKKLPFQNAFYAKCMSSESWKPEFSDSGKGPDSSFSKRMEASWIDLAHAYKRSALCKFWANMANSYKNCTTNGNVSWYGQTPEKTKDPNSFLLLAIHGRAERSDNNNPTRTGSALGIYLGTPSIKSYLEKNQSNLGLRPAFSFAQQVCNAK